MVLNYIWVAFFLIGFVVAFIKLIFFQDITVFPAMLQSTFDMSKTGFEISIYLTGVMTLWLGIMKIGEKGGMVSILSRLVGPFFSRLFPGVPKDHPANGSIIMSFSATLLGLDNAATPLGLKAMKELQELNPQKEIASDDQITFIVLKASGLTIIPVAIMADRATLGSVDPSSIFIPTLIATFCAAFAALLYLSFKQKINLTDPVLLSYLLGSVAIIASAVWYFTSLSDDELRTQSTLISSVIIISLIVSFILLGLRRKLPLFETFIEGAKDGFETSIKIIPYLVAILVAVGLFRASGSLNYITQGIGWFFSLFLNDTRFVDALPVAFLKPLSGSGARAMMMEISDPKKGFGPDSLVGNLASIFRGCAETTFYIIALYFGSVNIRKTRYALTGGLIADVAGVTAGIIVGYMFFH